MISIKVIRSQELEMALRCMQLSFAGDTFFRYLWPGADDYLRRFEVYARYYLELAIEQETAWQIEDFAGCFTAIPPGFSVNKKPLEKLMLSTCAESVVEELKTMDPPITDYLPDSPHWHVPLVAVDPGFQGRGLGGKLIDNFLLEVASNPHPVFLESSDPRNVSLYQRYGFEALDRYLLGGKPTVTPMLRPR